MKTLKLFNLKNEKLKEILAEALETGKEGAGIFLRINYKGVNYASMYKSLKRLEREKYLEISSETNKSFFKLTSKGKNFAEFLKFSFEKQKWDKKWRVLIFDIPEKQKKKRNFLRRKLKELGLKQLQMSVWITPYPLPKSFTWFLREIGINEFVRALTIEDINREDELKEMFGLK